MDRWARMTCRNCATEWRPRDEYDGICPRCRTFDLVRRCVMIVKENGQYVNFILSQDEIKRAIVKHIDQKYPACVSDDHATQWVYEDGKLAKVIVRNYYPEEEAKE